MVVESPRRGGVCTETVVTALVGKGMMRAGGRGVSRST